MRAQHLSRVRRRQLSIIRALLLFGTSTFVATASHSVHIRHFHEIIQQNMAATCISRSAAACTSAAQLSSRRISKQVSDEIGRKPKKKQTKPNKYRFGLATSCLFIKVGIKLKLTLAVWRRTLRAPNRCPERMRLRRFFTHSSASLCVSCGIFHTTYSPPSG